MARHTRVRSLPLCKGCRTCEAPGISTARAILWGSRHAGSKGNRRSPACGE